MAVPLPRGILPLSTSDDEQMAQNKYLIVIQLPQLVSSTISSQSKAPTSSNYLLLAFAVLYAMLSTLTTDDLKHKCVENVQVMISNIYLGVYCMVKSFSTCGLAKRVPPGQRASEPNKRFPLPYVYAEYNPRRKTRSPPSLLVPRSPCSCSFITSPCKG